MCKSVALMTQFTGYTRARCGQSKVKAISFERELLMEGYGAHLEKYPLSSKPNQVQDGNLPDLLAFGPLIAWQLYDNR